MSSPHHHSKIPAPPLRTRWISQRLAAASMERDIKSFCHELDYCGQTLPFWKSLPIEEVMGMIRAEFAKVKGEIDGELRGFAGDMDRAIEKSSECGSKDKLIMLQVTAEESARMSADKLWIWCELTVRMLDARGQELPTGRLKQAFAHLSSLLSRCSRLVRLHKERRLWLEEESQGCNHLSLRGVKAEITRERGERVPTAATSLSQLS